MAGRLKIIFWLKKYFGLNKILFTLYEPLYFAIYGILHMGLSIWVNLILLEWCQSSDFGRPGVRVGSDKTPLVCNRRL